MEHYDEEPVPHPAPSMLVFAEPMLVASKRGGGGLPVPVPETAVTSETVEFLNAILPPREWTEEDSATWRQFALPLAASREITAAVQRKLDAELVDRQARPSGLCSIREELFSQTFDEVIREVTLLCPERGLLLLRSRDELRLTMSAYRTLYESSTAYGTRRLRAATEGKAELQADVDFLEAECERSRARVNEARVAVQAVERKWAATRAADEERRKQELQFLLFQNQEMTRFAESAGESMAKLRLELRGHMGAAELQAEAKAAEAALASSSESESDSSSGDDESGSGTGSGTGSEGEEGESGEAGPAASGGAGGGDAADDGKSPA
mmetsp:Transcript_19947/g.70574  ORF Transcript_19947/g.70574 Transcript_19947/m.70574 type:complete len:326 (-) Transcript_19947:27-1004(-)